MIFAFAPHGFCFQAKAVEARFVLHDVTEGSGANEFRKRAKISIPAAVLIYGQKPAARRGQLRQFVAFLPGGGKRLVDNHIPTSEQTGLSQGEVRIVRRCHYAKLDGFIREQFVEIARHAHAAIMLLCQRSAALEKPGYFLPSAALYQGRRKGLPRQSKTYQSYFHHQKCFLSPIMATTKTGVAPPYQV